MKKFIKFILLSAIIVFYTCNVYSQQSFPVDLQNMKFIPDVMNNINVMVCDNNGGYKSRAFNLDSFPCSTDFLNHLAVSHLKAG